MALNCAALPEALIEGELFGHARGAFAGAHQANPGKIRLAAGSTLLLDEIGDMAPRREGQPAALPGNRRSLQRGVMRAETVDVCVVAATHQDLDQRVREGQFRKDVAYRLNTARAELLPLCEHQADLEQLIPQLIAHVEERHDLRVPGISEEVRRLFMRHAWPGNVRELHDVIESAALQADGGRRELQHLPAYVTAHTPSPEPLDERRMLVKALAQARGNKAAAAKQLHWSRMTLYCRLQRYRQGN